MNLLSLKYIYHPSRNTTGFTITITVLSDVLSFPRRAGQTSYSLLLYTEMARKTSTTYQQPYIFPSS
jgi:hypothetical protein